ncbi:hypothetical protein, partial [Methylobacterium indicum]|uniref:hypothetical protein n=1 Tax=Methylobacterium indicum TaxID=1775910 RepID=UPI000A9C0859
PLTLAANLRFAAHFIDDKVDEVLSPPAGRGETCAFLKVVCVRAAKSSLSFIAQADVTAAWCNPAYPRRSRH